MSDTSSPESLKKRIKELEKETCRLRQVEKALHESEGRYRVLIEEVGFGVTMIDSEYNIIMVNQILAEWTGKSPNELIGNKCYREFEQSDHVCDICPGAKVLVTGRKQTEVVMWKKFDGSVFPVRNQAFPLYDHNGEIYGFHELLEDITERKLAEEKLLTEKNFLDSLIKSLPGVMYLFDETGSFLLWNETFEKVTGFSGPEIKQMNPLDFIADKDKEKVRQAIEKCFRENQAVVDARLSTKEDSEVHYHFTGVSFTSNSSQYLIGVGVDITDRINAELEKEKLIRQLQEALSKVKLLSGFLPICAACKNIRDDRGYWNKIETYIKEHSEAEFTHGICPECAKRLYPELTRPEK